MASTHVSAFRCNIVVNSESARTGLDGGRTPFLRSMTATVVTIITTAAAAIAGTTRLRLFLFLTFWGSAALPTSPV